MFQSLLIAKSSTSPSITASSVVHPRASDAAVDYLSRRKVLLLPHLLDLFTLIAYLSGSFISMKFEDDFWPEFTMIVRVIAADALACLDRSREASGSSSASQQRYDVSTKLMISALKCICRVAKMKGAVRYMKVAALPLSWMVVPMLNSSMHADVIALATKALIALIPLNPTAIRAFIISLASLIRNDFHSGMLGANPIEVWAAIITEPRYQRPFI